ncbi:MAG: class I SAM-dependent methyltransferase [Candidatus Hinthialibacter antarcticus]|nr:class I SAM-dependent methyltransferase [Candidatus Hinthialibacter antarcticus]
MKILFPLFIASVLLLIIANTSSSQDDKKPLLAPVYPKLADWFVEQYDLAGLEGVALDIGSGRGDLILELCSRTRLHWVNADINAKAFPAFLQRIDQAGFTGRASAMLADAQHLPFKDNYADVIVSRGSIPFWGDVKAGLAEVYRVLKPGCVAYIGRGFSENVPVETARAIRDKQNKSRSFPAYDPDEAEATWRKYLMELGIENFRIIRPRPAGSDGINYGVWIEMKK